MKEKNRSSYVILPIFMFSHSRFSFGNLKDANSCTISWCITTMSLLLLKVCESFRFGQIKKLEVYFGLYESFFYFYREEKTKYILFIRSKFNTRSRSLNDDLLFKWRSRQMVQVWLCTLLVTLDKSAIFTVIPKDNGRVYTANFYVNIEKFILFHRLLDRLSYLELGTSSTFRLEVFKPRTEK